MTKPCIHIHTKRKNKARTTILIRRDLLEKAKKLGLNISRITENALEAYINRLKDIQNEIIKTSSFKPENSQAKGRERETVGVSWWTGRDLNPRPPDCKSHKTPTVSYNLPLDWSKFRVWLKNRFSSGYARDIYNYARRYYGVLLYGEAGELLSLSGDKRRMVMSSLSNLSKFLGLYKEWKRIVEGYGLKWSQNNAEDYVISRMANSRVQGDITCWIQQVKLKLPRLCYFMDFALCSGLRFSESINSSQFSFAVVMAIIRA